MKQQALGIALGALVAVAVAWAGSNGVGSGGFQGFPAAGGADITDGGSVGGCVLAAGQIYCPVGKFDTLDAGVANVVGQMTVGGPLVVTAGAVFATATGVEFGGNSTVGVGTDTGAGNVELYSNSAIQWIVAGASGDLVTPLDRGIRPFSIRLKDNTPVFQYDATLTLTACTSPAAGAQNGSATFQIGVGTSCTGISAATVAGLPATTNGYSCACRDVTTPASYTVEQTGGSTTSVVVTHFSRTTGLAADWVNGQSFACFCGGL